jgi:PleD family two-component response regulator
MAEDKKPSFDLPTLLRLGDLDIRRIAAEKQLLTVRDYFDLLSRFIDIAPKITKALTRIADLQSTEKDFVQLAEEKTLLEELGYNKLVPVIDGIISAGEKGDMETAADYAKQSVGDFNRLYTRTESAIRTGVSETPASTTDSGDAAFNIMSYSPDYGKTAGGKPLKEVVQQVDSAEANRKMRILAVDDSPSTLKTIIASLKDQYKVFTLSNPTQVKRFLQQVTPELFLLDYKMPELNGFELVPIIRSFEEHKDTPIIFLTSLGTKGNISVAAMLGACDFVVKPFDSYTLHDKIAKHIVRKKLF